jgi:hypothetical protein
MSLRIRGKLAGLLDGDALGQRVAADGMLQPSIEHFIDG